MPALALPVVIGAAVIDSINPCAFGVLIFLLAYMMKYSKDKKKVLGDGIGYIIGVYLTYLFLGVAIYAAIGSFVESFRAVTVIFYQLIGIIIIIFGILELKDFFLYGKGPSLSIFPGFVSLIKKRTAALSKKSSTNYSYSLLIAVVLGFLVALVELRCTGAPYIAVITILSQSGFSVAGALPFLAAYNIIFVLPLIGIIAIVYHGTGTKRLMQWKNAHKGFMRLATGVLLIALGLFIFFFDLLLAG